MPKKAKVPGCSRQQREALEDLANNRTAEARLVERARIVNKCLEGKFVGKEVTGSQLRNTIVNLCI